MVETPLLHLRLTANVVNAHRVVTVLPNQPPCHSQQLQSGLTFRLHLSNIVDRLVNARGKYGPGGGFDAFCRGCKIGGMDALHAEEDFRRRMLRFDAGAEKILEAAEAFPDAPRVQLYAAALHLYGQSGADDLRAREYLERAHRCGAKDAAPRLLQALTFWQAQRYHEAAGALETRTEEEPQDLLAAKFCEFLYYILGQQHSGPRFLAHMERLLPVHAEDPDFLAMHSFAHELCGHFDEARGIAERALALESRNPWAEHTLSHVLIRQGGIAEGERRLRAFLPQAATCSRPIHAHTAWHLALFAVERLDHAAARDIFHQHIWGYAPDATGEQIEAIALLWRMEMAGAEPAAEWDTIADHVERHADESFLPFLSAHHAFALARTGRTEAFQRLALAVDARGDEPLWRDLGRPVVLAAAAFGRGMWEQAADGLKPVMPRITAVGGSDAQDDLFRQMYFCALARAGRSAEARAYWESSCAGKRQSPLDEFFLSGI